MSVSSNIFYAFVGFVVLWLIFLGVLLLPSDPTNEPVLPSDQINAAPAHGSNEKLDVVLSNYKTEVRPLKKKDSLQARYPLKRESQPVQVHIPLAAEWLSIRSEGKDVVQAVHGDKLASKRADAPPAAHCCIEPLVMQAA